MPMLDLVWANFVLMLDPGCTNFVTQLDPGCANFVLMLDLGCTNFAPMLDLVLATFALLLDSMLSFVCSPYFSGFATKLGNVPDIAVTAKDPRIGESYFPVCGLRRVLELAELQVLRLSLPPSGTKFDLEFVGRN